MAKSKKPPSANNPRVPTPHIFARINYLYQAAHLISTTSYAPSGLSRSYISTARTVAKKNVLRLSPAIKRTLCRTCDTVLIPGVSCATRVENRSRGGKKQWVDVLVMGCTGCGAEKRFPVGMEERREARLWCEREDVVVGMEEKKKEEGLEATRGEGERGGRTTPAE